MIAAAIGSPASWERVEANITDSWFGIAVKETTRGAAAQEVEERQDWTFAAGPGEFARGKPNYSADHLADDDGSLRQIRSRLTTENTETTEIAEKLLCGCALHFNGTTKAVVEHPQNISLCDLCGLCVLCG